ncbi:MAG: adenylate kinase [Acidimicrobiia bacterium]
MRLLFVGPPGAGKGTQAALVASRLGVPHISTGEMFRYHVASETELGRQVQALMELGAYVPDELTVAMLAERMRSPDTEKGFILDGFPRTIGQVESLDNLLGANGLDRVVLFDVDEEQLVQRMLSRGRADDSEETIRSRFKVYEEQTAPLVDLYRGRGLVVAVDGEGDVDEVTDRLLRALET